MNIPRSSLRTGRLLVNSLNYEGIAMVGLQFYHFHNGDRLRIGSVTRLNSLND